MVVGSGKTWPQLFLFFLRCESEESEGDCASGGGDVEESLTDEGVGDISNDVEYSDNVMSEAGEMVGCSTLRAVIASMMIARVSRECLLL